MSNKITSMGTGTCHCCNSTVNDTISRVHLHGHKLQDASYSLSHTRETQAGNSLCWAGTQVWMEGR